MSLDGGAFAACANAPVRIGATECWSILLAAVEMDAEEVLFRAVAEGCNPYTITLYPEAAYTPARATRLDNADVATSSRLAAIGYTAPDNAGIVAVRAKTDNLPADPASNTQVLTRLAAADYVAPDNAGISAAQSAAGAVAGRVTDTRAARLDNVDAPISGVPAAVWNSTTRTLTDLGLTGLGANPVTVTVQDDKGAPVCSAGVTVWNAAKSAVQAIAVTDQAGNATLNLKTGDVFLAVLSTGSYVAEAPLAYTVVSGAQSAPVITLASTLPDLPVLDGLCQVDFVLLDGAGQPLAGYVVRAALLDARACINNALILQQQTTATTDANGCASLRLIQKGKFTAGGGAYQVVVTDASGKVRRDGRVLIPDETNRINYEKL
jgi:hypothetical protein